jgi:hypothetical protein
VVHSNGIVGEGEGRTGQVLHRCLDGPTAEAEQQNVSGVRVDGGAAVIMTEESDW